MPRTPAAVLAVALFLAPTALAQTYTVAELTTPPGMTRALPQDLSDSGRALVIYENSQGATRTFVFDKGTPTDLGVFQGLARSEGYSINEDGVVVGSSWAATGFPARAWRWEDGVFTSLGSIGGYANGLGVNDAGHATGWASTTTAGSGGSTVAFFHDGISMRSMGQTASGYYADAWAINAEDQVVGTFLSRRRVSLSGGYVGDPVGGLHELPTLGGLNSNALDINNAGQVVGSSETGAFGADNRFLLQAFVWSDGVMRGLGTLPEQTQSVALSINGAGDIVGGSYSDSFSALNRWAVLWPQGGDPIDLNTRIPAGSGVHLTGASAINASGQVLAAGFITGETQIRAYLLTPAP